MNEEEKKKYREQLAKEKAERKARMDAARLLKQGAQPVTKTTPPA